MSTKTRVLSFKDLPVRLPIHGTITAFLLLDYLKEILSPVVHIVVSTIFAMFFCLIWLAAIYTKLVREEPVSLLNTEMVENNSRRINRGR